MDWISLDQQLYTGQPVEAMLVGGLVVDSQSNVHSFSITAACAEILLKIPNVEINSQVGVSKQLACWTCF